MQKMEKILEEIEQAKREPWYRLNNHDVKSRIDGAIERIIEIVRKHMFGKGMNVHANDGWIPVGERMPEEKINPISRDFYEYQVTAKFGNAKDVRYYRYGNGHWWNGPGIVDKYVIAWRENPEPYKPKQPETCKYTGGSCCWPIDQCKECPNYPERSEEE